MYIRLRAKWSTQANMKERLKGKMNNAKRSKWTLVFYDMASDLFTPRTRLHRELKRQGVAMHSQSVYCIPYTANSFQQLKAIGDSVCVVKADVPDEKVGQLVAAYDVFIERLFTEVEGKIEELEDAKVAVTEHDPRRKRGYSKRLNKMHDRLDHLAYITKLRTNLGDEKGLELYSRVSNLINRVGSIEHAPPGTLINWENALVKEIDEKEKSN